MKTLPPISASAATGLPLRSGFTLLEVLAAVSVLAILALFLFPVAGRTMESGRRARCIGNLQQIGLAMKNYANDHDQKFPFTFDSQLTWDGLLVRDDYLDPRALACPSDKIKRTVPGDIRSYAYNGYVGDFYLENNPRSLQGSMVRASKPLSDLILVADRGGATSVVNHPDYASAYNAQDCHGTHKDGANYLFADLHVAWMTETGDSEFSENAGMFKKHWLTD